MSQPTSPRGILYIDDEEKSLKYFQAIFGDLCPIYTASSPEAGYDLFVQKHDQIALVLSDKKMPNESGLELLERMREFDPKPFRILVTAFADLNVAVECLNDGLLYSYLTKPWDPIELEHRLMEALQHYSALRDREQLIEEKSQVVKQLMMADKASSIGILSRGLNHHLRNSLTVMQTFYDMLPYQLEQDLGSVPRDSEFWGEYLHEVGTQIDRMTMILSSLEEGSENRATGEFHSVHLNPLIAANIRMVCGDSDDIEVRFHVCEKETEIMAEKPAIDQLVRMLILEAKKNLAGKGVIEIRLTEEAEGEGNVILEIADDGDPIPEEERKHLFDPFFVRSDKPEELGMSLLACYMTVYRHGGEICSREDDEGRNVIEVRLPLEAPRTRSTPDIFRSVETGRSASGAETALPS